MLKITKFNSLARSKQPCNGVFVLSNSRLAGEEKDKAHLSAAAITMEACDAHMDELPAVPPHRLTTLKRLQSDPGPYLLL